MADDGWCLIESDPGIFTELLQQIGVQHLQVEDLYSMDFDTLEPEDEVCGLIFLFKWKPPSLDDGSNDDSAEAQPAASPNLFFAKQVINRVCATQAILSIVLNSPVDVGETLADFRDTVRDFDPYMKGLAISNLETVRVAHNSFSPDNHLSIEHENRAPEKDDEVYHFVSYVPFEGAIYELDGMRKAPVNHGAYEGNWLDAVRPILQRRVSESHASEIRFNLMAVVRNRRERYEKERDGLRERLQKLSEKGSATTDEEDAEMSELVARADDLDAKIADEEAKFARWRKENVRRKHNYLPFVIELLKLLASKGELSKMIEQAKEKARQRQQRQQEQQPQRHT